jgi:hypothetical protein
MKSKVIFAFAWLVYFGNQSVLFALPNGMPTPPPPPSSSEDHYAYRGVVMDSVFTVSDTTVQEIQQKAKFVKIWNVERSTYVCVMIVGVFDNIGLYRDPIKGDRPLEAFDSSVGGVIIVPVDDSMCPMRP